MPFSVFVWAMARNVELVTMAVGHIVPRSLPRRFPALVTSPDACERHQPVWAGQSMVIPRLPHEHQ